MTPPRVVETRRQADAIALTLDLPVDHPMFQGHFPEQAMLPGVAQLGWALQLGRINCPGLEHRRFLGVDKLKFSRIIQPGKRLELELRATDSRLSFSYRDAQGEFSSGHIRFAD